MPPKRQPDPGLVFIVKRLKEELKSKGGSGFLGLQRKFKIIADDDGDKLINLSEFKKAMKEMRMNLNDMELRTLFEFFDCDSSGSIDFDEFIQGLREPMPPRRHDLVQQAWAKIDRNLDGSVNAEEIAGMYDVSRHPDVVSGKMTRDQALRVFLSAFETRGDSDGIVTREEFENYYTNLSANIEKDDYFELMIRNAWHISGGKGQAANSANRRVLVTHKDGRQSVEEINDDMGLRSNDKSGLMKRLKSQNIDANDIGLYDTQDNTNGKGFSRQRNASNAANFGFGSGNGNGNGNGNAPVRRSGRAAGPPLSRRRTGVAAMFAGDEPSVDSFGGMGGGGGGGGDQDMPDDYSQESPRGGGGSSSRPYDPPSARGNNNGNSNSNGNSGVRTQTRGMSADTRDAPNPGTQFTITRLKDQLKSHGGSGFLGLQRKFKIIADDDGNNVINLGEFKKCLKELKLDISDIELRMLFEFFDKDRSGSIDFEEFIAGLRDPLSPRRLDLVRQAWSKIDRNGDGIVDITEVAALYDVSKHPDVISKRKSPEDAYREFLSVFERGGNVDGSVTQEEFENYYTNLGASIEKDDYFELMIRNAWHISGGKGWAENSSNRRVLVTGKDGKQRVQEISSDLGLKSDDKQGMMRRLKAQGVDVEDIGLHDYQDGTKGQKVRGRTLPVGVNGARARPSSASATSRISRTTKTAW
eukprot:gene8244-16960_t